MKDDFERVQSGEKKEFEGAVAFLPREAIGSSDNSTKSRNEKRDESDTHEQGFSGAAGKGARSQ